MGPSALDPMGNLVVSGGVDGTVDPATGLTPPAPGSHGFLAKIDCTGAYTWVKWLVPSAGSYATVAAVAVDAAGGIVMAGDLHGTVDFGTGPLTASAFTDIFVAKWDAAGNALWSKRFPATAGMSSWTSSMAVSATGTIFLSAGAAGSVDFGGGPLSSTGFFLAALTSAGGHVWSKQYGLGEAFLAVDPSGNLLISGVSGYPGAPTNFGGGNLASGMYVAKLDGAGNHVWSKAWQTSPPFNIGITGTHVASDPAGSLIVSARAAGGQVDFGGGLVTLPYATNFLVASWSSTGASIFARAAGDAAMHGGYRVATDATGNILLTGSMGAGTVDFGGGPLSTVGMGYDVVAVKLTSAGGFVWQRRYGSGNNQGAGGISTDLAGAPILTGSFAGVLDFGQGPLTPSSTSTAQTSFIAKLAP